MVVDASSSSVKTEPFGIEVELAVEPVLPPLHDVGAVSLARVHGLYGMARPSFRRRGLVGGSGGGMGMDISVLGVDLGQNLCSVVGLDAFGAMVMRRKMRRETLIALAEKLPACIVGMEACCGAHHLGRAFAAHGHDVRLMSPGIYSALRQGPEERRTIATPRGSRKRRGVRRCGLSK